MSDLATKGQLHVVKRRRCQSSCIWGKRTENIHLNTIWSNWSRRARRTLHRNRHKEVDFIIINTENKATNVETDVMNYISSATELLITMK